MELCTLSKLLRMICTTTYLRVSDLGSETTQFWSTGTSQPKSLFFEYVEDEMVLNHFDSTYNSEHPSEKQIRCGKDVPNFRYFFNVVYLLLGRNRRYMCYIKVA